jgi:hypothetical protein
MISFKKYITEVTAESYDYDWDSFTFKMGEGDFTTVNGRIINYSIEHDKNVVIRIVDHIEHHEISFAVSLGYRDTTVKTDTGNPFRVFMTVKKMTDEYMKKYGDKIKMVTFSAAKTDEVIHLLIIVLMLFHHYHHKYYLSYLSLNALFLSLIFY